MFVSVIVNSSKLLTITVLEKSGFVGIISILIVYGIFYPFTDTFTNLSSLFDKAYVAFTEIIN